MKQWIIRILIKAWMPEYMIVPRMTNKKELNAFIEREFPGIHAHNNPVAKPKLKFVHPEQAMKGGMNHEDRINKG
jgi:hypothetical protein